MKKHLWDPFISNTWHLRQNPWSGLKRKGTCLWRWNWHEQHPWVPRACCYQYWRLSQQTLTKSTCWPSLDSIMLLLYIYCYIMFLHHKLSLRVNTQPTCVVVVICEVIFWGRGWLVVHVILDHLHWRRERVQGLFQSWLKTHLLNLCQNGQNNMHWIANQ